MPVWNELHYQRAQEFARLVAEAVAAGNTPVARPAAPAPPNRAPISPTPPPPAPPAATPPAPAPTAGSVFNKMPWKK